MSDPLKKIDALLNKLRVQAEGGEEPAWGEGDYIVVTYSHEGEPRIHARAPQFPMAVRAAEKHIAKWGADGGGPVIYLVGRRGQWIEKKSYRIDDPEWAAAAWQATTGENPKGRRSDMTMESMAKPPEESLSRGSEYLKDAAKFAKEGTKPLALHHVADGLESVADALKALDKADVAGQIEAAAKAIEYGNGKPGEKPPIKVERDTYTYGTTPEDVIREKLPSHYSMELNRTDVVSLLKAVKEMGDKAFIDQMTDEFGGGDIDEFIKNPKEMLGPGKSSLSLDPDTMVKLLKALGDSSDDNAMMLRSDILTTLDIEEV